jgi:hypothetical protein
MLLNPHKIFYVYVHMYIYINLDLSFHSDKIKVPILRTVLRCVPSNPVYVQTFPNNKVCGTILFHILKETDVGLRRNIIRCGRFFVMTRFMSPFNHSFLGLTPRSYCGEYFFYDTRFHGALLHF